MPRKISSLTLTPVVRRGGFNEAAASMPRKIRSRPRLTAPRPRSFNEAAASMPRKIVKTRARAVLDAYELQ